MEKKMVLFGAFVVLECGSCCLPCRTTRRTTASAAMSRSMSQSATRAIHCYGARRLFVTLKSICFLKALFSSHTFTHHHGMLERVSFHIWVFRPHSYALIPRSPALRRPGLFAKPPLHTEDTSGPPPRWIGLQRPGRRPVRALWSGPGGSAMSGDCIQDIALASTRCCLGPIQRRRASWPHRVAAPSTTRPLI
ncbi:hypothetical protein BDW22DRAFT_1356628 [Trametopsis cervina]|nr:hypothetical protein BDW22DRAFT_1356628 [Trametopsis cervina]